MQKNARIRKTKIMLVLLFALFEMIDIFSNKSENFVDIAKNEARNFAQNPLLFFLKQANFLLLAFCIFALEIDNAIIICIFVCYTADLCLKLHIIKCILNGVNFGFYDDLFAANPKISKKSRLIVSSLIILLFYIAIA